MHLDANSRQGGTSSGDVPFSAIVLAGTYGWGGLDLPVLPPRPLAELAFEPVITCALRWIASAGARRAVLCANGSTRVLRERLGTAYRGLELLFEEDRLPRGPAGCIRDAARLTDGDTIVVAEGTIVPRVDLADLLRTHTASGAALTVVTSPTPDGGHAPAGVYVLHRRTLQHVPDAGFQDLKEGLIPKLHAAGEPVAMYASARGTLRVADVPSYLAISRWVLEQLVAGAWPADAVAGWTRNGDVVAHPSVLIESGALLVGPVLAAARVHITAEAAIVGPAVIGEGAFIGPGALVSGSIVGAGSLVAGSAMVHDCVLPQGSLVNPGASLHSRSPQPLTRAPWLRRLWTTAGRGRAGRRAAAPAPSFVTGNPARIRAGRDALDAKEVVRAWR